MRSLRNAKVRWSIGISAVIWSCIFLMAVGATNTNGGNYFYSPGIVHWLLLIAAGGAFITWPILWLALSVGESLLDVLRRLLGLRSRQGSATYAAHAEKPMGDGSGDV